MPIYDYDCAACGRRFETVHGVHADPPGSCPLCGGGPVRKAFTPPTIVFKGSGWAKRDRRSTSAKASSGTDASSDTADKGDASSAPAKDGGDTASKPMETPKPAPTTSSTASSD